MTCEPEKSCFSDIPAAGPAVSNGPRYAVLLGGTHSGCGKTTMTLALLRALHKRGLRIQPFKCGPDYIDPEFHQMACGMQSVNLDSFLQGPQGMKHAFARYAGSADAAVIEGVMGLFDGKSPHSIKSSSAECAILLDLPVILTVNARGIGGSIAPLVSGFTRWHPSLKIAGVFASQTGSFRHIQILRESLEKAHLPPLLGALPRDCRFTLPERHLGLIPTLEHPLSEDLLNLLADELEKHSRLDDLLQLCRFQEKPFTHPPFSHSDHEDIVCPVLPENISSTSSPRHTSLRLAVAMDEAFHFYYRENLDMLRDRGVEIAFFSPLHDQKLPENTAGVWLGGGFPEMFAEELSANLSMKQSLKDLVGLGGILYGECGGYLYLLNQLETDDSVITNRSQSSQSAQTTQTHCHIHPMAGFIPRNARMNQKLSALGYRTATCVSNHAFFKKGTVIHGHEFHYSSILPANTQTSGQPQNFTCQDNEIQDLWNALDSRMKEVPSAAGYASDQICASYVHVHFASNPEALDHFILKLQQAHYTIQNRRKERTAQ